MIGEGLPKGCAAGTVGVYRGEASEFTSFIVNVNGKRRGAVRPMCLMPEDKRVKKWNILKSKFVYKNLNFIKF